VTTAVPPLCGTLVFRVARPLATDHGPFTAYEFTDLVAHQPVLAVVRGDCRGHAPILARVHSSCLTGESVGSADCDCAEQLDAALGRIAAAGRGVLFYLLQEGRGAGLVAKARDRMLVQASRDRVTTFDAYARMGLDRDCRRYDPVAFAYAALDLAAPLQLLSNNPEKLAALRAAGVAIAGSDSLSHAPSAFNLAYLTAKSQSGHAFAVASPSPLPAELPETVEAIEPTPLATAPQLLHVASYLLPVRIPPPTGGVRWLRLHAYVDRDSGRERIVVTPARPGAARPLAHVYAESLDGRFVRPRHDHPWHVAVARLTERGAGAALFLLHDEPGLDGGRDAADLVAGRAELVRLLAHHLPGRAELLAPHPALAAALAAADVECGR
jgi:GTP cyclohydrolase II